MKYCSHCGKEVLDEAVICPNCGCRTNYTAQATQNAPSGRNKILGTIAKILMLIQTIGQGLAALGLIITAIVVNLSGEIAQGIYEYIQSNTTTPESVPAPELIIGIFVAYFIALAVGYLITLAWCIPMTITTWRKLQRRENMGVGFRVCVLIFVNLIAGILLLCLEEEPTQNYQQTNPRP